MGKVRYIFRPGVSHGTGRGHTSQSVIYRRQWTVTTYSDPTWQPPTDVYETAGTYVIKVEIAGMKDDDFHITFADRILSITGTRHDFDAKLGYHQMEVAYGEFRTEVELCESVDADSIQAVYQNGFLVVTVPKR